MQAVHMASNEVIYIPISLIASVCADVHRQVRVTPVLQEERAISCNAVNERVVRNLKVG